MDHLPERKQFETEQGRGKVGSVFEKHWSREFGVRGNTGGEERQWEVP